MGLGRWFKRKPDSAKGALQTRAPAINGATLGARAPQATGPVTDKAWSVPADSPSGMVGRHVLVVEDHAVSRKVVGLLLQSMGHRVSFAENGVQGLAMAASGHFDLVLMDIHMPEMDGFTCTRKIRALPGPAGQVPVVALTTDLRGSVLEQAQLAGMQRVLSKPLQKSQLATVLP